MDSRKKYVFGAGIAHLSFVVLSLLVIFSAKQADAQWVYDADYSCPENMTTSGNLADRWWCWLYGTCNEEGCIFEDPGYYHFNNIFYDAVEESAYASFRVDVPEAGGYWIDVVFRDGEGDAFWHPPVNRESGWSLEVGGRGTEYQVCPTNVSSYCGDAGDTNWVVFNCSKRVCLRDETEIIFRPRDNSTGLDVNFTCPDSADRKTVLRNISIRGPDNSCFSHDDCCFAAECCLGQCCNATEKCEQMLSGGVGSGMCCTKFKCDDVCFTELFCVRQCQECLGAPGCCGDETCEASCQREAAIFPIKAILYAIAAGFATVMIAIHGIKYIFADDAASRENAKRGIIYVILGLIILMIAGALVGFLLGSPL